MKSQKKKTKTKAEAKTKAKKSAALPLSKWRLRIDACDREIMKICKKRFENAHKIGTIKAKMGMRVRDIQREREVMEDRIKLGAKYGLTPIFIKKIMTALFKEAYRHQR